MDIVGGNGGGEEEEQNDDDWDPDQLREDLLYDGLEAYERQEKQRSRRTLEHEPNLDEPLYTIKRPEEDSYALCVLYLSFKDILVIGRGNGKIEVWSLVAVSRRFRLTAVLVRSRFPVSCLVGVNSRYIVSGHRDGRLIVWDLFKRKHIGEYIHHMDDVVNDAILLSMFNPFCVMHNLELDDEEFKKRKKKKPKRTRFAREYQQRCSYKLDLLASIVASVGDDRCIRLWRVSDQHHLRTIFYDMELECVHEMQDGRLVAGDFFGCITVWDLRSSEDKGRTFMPHGSNVTAVLELRPEKGEDGQFHTIVVSSANDCEISFREDLGMKTMRQANRRRKAYARSLLQLEDGRVVAGGNASFRVFDSKGNQLYERLRPSQIEDMCKLDRMGFIALAFEDGSVEMWKLTENSYVTTSCL